MNRSTRNVSTVQSTAIATLLLLPLAGCGESQQDRFLKHAQRDRDVTASQAAEPATADPPVLVKQTSVQKPQVIETRSVAVAEADGSGAADQPSTAASPSDEGSERLAEQLGIKPISERQPEEELSVVQRRKHAYENLQAINEALMMYVQKNGRYPKRYLTNAGGVPTLSWRVELLPILGYQELYEKFDTTRAWNLPPNKDLLQYIPDEFVSPERFDETTNFLLPAKNSFMFGENRPLTPSMLDDGAENTIMLLEVNEAYAVHWTEPKDFEPKSAMQMSGYLGGLREDGTFALWASGFPVLLGKELSNAQLFQAMTHAKSDGPRAGDIHRPITIEEAEADPAVEDGVPGDQMLAAESERPGVSLPGLNSPDPNEGQIAKRDPVPPVSELTVAQEKLRVIYRDRIVAAKTEADKSKLATELIATAEQLEADPAGAYVLQRAALSLAVAAADATALLTAVDQRVARFEVDSFEENLKWIQAFGEATASRDSSLVKSGPLILRSIPVIYTGIQSDKYMSVSSVARIANRFTSSRIEDGISRLLTRLRSQLGSAKREYDQSVDDLNRYRKNPDDSAAGAAFGRFLCFIKGDWQKGLPLIAEGPGGDLTEVAGMDLRGARSAIDQAAIGDAWWELSERGNGIYRQGARDRAVVWYTEAHERLPESLDRLHVKNRLHEAERSDARSPVALCQQLADALGVDLSQSLTSIAVNGNRSAQRSNNDDD